MTQDTSHHLVQIDLSVPATTVSCKTGSLMVCLFSTNFSLLIRHTSTDFEDIFAYHSNLVHIVSFGIYCSVLEWGRGGGGWVEWGGLISNLNCPFTIYCCAMEKGVFMLYFIFHQFCINFLDMPHRIWKKISQIM